MLEKFNFPSSARRGVRATRIAVVIAALALAGASLTPLAAAAATTGSISGVVTGSDAPGVGLSNVDVQLMLPGGSYVDDTSTDSNGGYSFTGVSATTYLVQFGSDYNTGHLGATSDPVTVASGQTVTGINAALQLGGTITGKISTSTGPLTQGGGVALAAAGSTINSPGDLFSIGTNSDGSFSFTGVTPGTYSIYFQGPSGSNLVPQYWSGASSFATANFFTVTAGQTVTGKDAVLQPGASISGTVTGGAGNSPLSFASVDAFASDGTALAGAETTSSGTYTISGLAPGAVTLRFQQPFQQNLLTQWWSGASSESNAQYFNVPAAASLTGYNAHLSIGATIAGTIRDSNGNPIASSSVFAFTPDGTLTATGFSDFSGSYSIPALAAGDYTVRFDGSGGDNYVSSWWNGAATAASATVIHLADQQQLTGVDATLGTGASISGTISGLSANGVSFLAPNPTITAFRPDGSQAGQAYGDIDGTYSISNLAAGTYLLKIEPQGDTTDFQSAWYLNSSSQASATAVTVTTGQALTGIDDTLPSSSTTSGVTTAGGFDSLAPFRLLDTRSGVGAPTGAVAPNGVVSLQVTGRGGVPATGVSAVVLNVTVAEGKSPGFITVYGDGTTRPTASNLNFGPGQIVPNLVVAPVGADGKVDLYNGSSGTTQIIADVAGYYLSGTPSDPGTFGALAPARLLDTRSGVGAPTGAVAPNGVVSLQVTGRGGVPATGVSAVVLNVTVAEGKSPGFVTVYGDGTTRPTASNLNFGPGQIVPNLVVAPVGADGKVDLYNGSSGTTQIIADVAGYYLSGTPSDPGTFGALAPARLLDTRSGVGAPTGAVAPNGVVSLQVTGRGGVPATGVSAVVLNVTVAEGKSPGFITVYGDGTTRPTASNLNFGPGQIVPNLVVAPVGADGKVDLYNGSSGTTQIIADVAGWFTAAP